MWNNAVLRDGRSVLWVSTFESLYDTAIGPLCEMPDFVEQMNMEDSNPWAGGST